MNGRPTHKLVREGDLVAEVRVHLIVADDPWAPYLTLEDAYKLDEVRDALRGHDIRRAADLSDRVYRLTPVA